MSTTTATADRTARATDEVLTPGEAFAMVLDSAVSAAAAKVERTVTRLTDKFGILGGDSDSSGVVTRLADDGLDVLAGSGGVVQRASAEGVRAGLHGESPARALIRTAWQTGAPAVKAAIVTSAAAAVLLLLLSPVLLIVYLLTWLVIAAVCRALSARRRTRAAR